jgi:import receptor subunit TOM70
LKALHRRAKAFEHTNDLELCLEDITATCILEGFQNNATLILADRILKELGRKHAKDAMKNKRTVEPSKNFINNYFKSFFQDPIKKFKLDVKLVLENHSVMK